jgi:hypothetical protein
MSGTITFETRILSGADDVEQGTSGSVIFDSSDLPYRRPRRPLSQSLASREYKTERPEVGANSGIVIGQLRRAQMAASGLPRRPWRDHAAAAGDRVTLSKIK